MPQSPATSTTGNRFSLFSLTTAHQWDADRIRAAATRAGFTDNGYYIALRDSADEPLTAIMFPLHRDLSGPVNRLRFERATGFPVGLGARLAAALTLMALDLDAVIRDADYKVLSPAELQAEGEAIDLDAVQRMEATAAAVKQRNEAAMQIEEEKRRPVRQPDGTVRLPGSLSFTHTTTTVRGRWLDEVHFDAQPMTWHEGRREGLRRAGDLLALVKEGGGHRVQTGRILAAALGTTLPSGTYSTSSTDNVAIGFINAIVAMLEGASQHLDHAGFIERSIEDSHSQEKLTAQWDLERNKKTAQKAAASRAARRAAVGVAA